MLVLKGLAFYTCNLELTPNQAVHKQLSLQIALQVSNISHQVVVAPTGYQLKLEQISEIMKWDNESISTL